MIAGIVLCSLVLSLTPSACEARCQKADRAAPDKVKCPKKMKARECKEYLKAMNSVDLKKSCLAGCAGLESRQKEKKQK